MEKTDVSKGRLLALAAEEGLASKQSRMQCPACRHEDARACSISEPSGYAVWSCQRCGAGGSAVDLLAHSRSISAGEAMKLLRDRDAAPAPLPQAPTPVDPAKVWAAATDNDPAGLLYLRGRGLDAAADKGFVRFNVGRSGEAWADRKAATGYRVAMPLFDKHGQLRSMQLRAVRPCDVPKLSLPGSYPCHLAFGLPLLAETAPVVYLAEGIADTLALLLAGFIVVGAAGSRQARHLAEFVGQPAGRDFVLCRQRDPNPRGQADADEAFAALAATLQAAGGRVRTVLPPEGTKDPAEWLQQAGMERFRGLVSGPRALPAVERERVVAPKPQAPKPPAAATPKPPASEALAPVLELPEPKLRSFTKSYASICAILRSPAALAKIAAGPLEWNEMLGAPTIARRLVEDAELSSIRERIEVEFKTSKGVPIRPSDSDVAKAVVQVAREKPYHPVADWLRSLRWDGTERIAAVSDEILGVSRDALTQSLVRKWFVSAVARALTPGCKVDLVWILQGKQGTRKSTFFNVLAGDEWFSDSPVDLHDKDSKLLLRKVWILEWAELEAMQRSARASTAKAFISSRIDHFRPPYARGFVSSPRHTVIVGTTNEDEILEDATGNRRYWILPVPDSIDTEKLAAQRDQLWAEAVAAFVAGEAWHVEEAEQAKLEEQHEQWTKRDPWEPIISELLHAKMSVYQAAKRSAKKASILRDMIRISTTSVITEQIRKEAQACTRFDSMRVAAILRSSGWTNYRAMDAGRPRYWIPAELAEAVRREEESERRQLSIHDPTDPTSDPTF